MADAVVGSNRISGIYGKFWFNGVLLMEVKELEAKITPERSEVWIGIDKDSKMNGLAGEGSFTVEKTYTRGKKEILEAWKKGIDTRVSFVSSLDDPNSIRQQSERVSIGNAWINELLLAKWSRGEVVEEETTFGFTPTSASFLDTIEAM